MATQKIKVFAFGLLIGASAVFVGQALPRLFRPIHEKPILMKTVVEMNNFRAKLKAYYQKCGVYPSTLALASGEVVSCEQSTLSRADVADPWGNRYQFYQNGDSFRLVSCGGSWLEVTDQLAVNTVSGKD